MAAVPTQVIELVERFDRNRDANVSTGYNEAQFRHEFLEPFFEALGWDVYNRLGSAMPYRKGKGEGRKEKGEIPDFSLLPHPLSFPQVILEDSLKVGGGTKAPDYSFRIGGTRKFFVEAKKPSVKIATDVGPAFQLRRYAWSAKLPLSILTNGDEFTVYRPANKGSSDAHALSAAWTPFRRCGDSQPFKPTFQA